MNDYEHACPDFYQEDINKSWGFYKDRTNNMQLTFNSILILRFLANF